MFLVQMTASVKVTDVLLSEVLEWLVLSSPTSCEAPVRYETCVQDHWKESCFVLNSALCWWCTFRAETDQAVL